jgi:hypothetical protein
MEVRPTGRGGEQMDEFDKIKQDTGTLLRDIRGAIDELLVKVDLGEKDARDLAGPLIEKIDSQWCELRARFEG